MQDHNPPSRRRHVNPSGNPPFGPDPQFPELAVEMLDMRFAKRFQTDVLHHLQQPDQPGAQFHRQGLDFGIDDGDGFDRPSHSNNIACPLYCFYAAEQNGVHQFVCKLDWDRHGRTAPSRRNDELLNLFLVNVIATPASASPTT